MQGSSHYFRGRFIRQLIPFLAWITVPGVCVGEGESAFLEVVEKLKRGEDFLQTGNIIYKKDGKVVENYRHPLISNLDELPMRRPYTDDHIIIENGKVLTLDQKKYFEILPSEKTCYTQIFSRGCPYACSYCCNSKYREIYPEWSKLRSMSVTSIINEIHENIKLNPHIIKVFIIDDCFLAHDIEWLADFTKKWKEKINKELNFFTIPEYVTEEKLDILRTIEFSYCSIGLQSGSEKTNKIYNRKFSKELFLKACNMIRSMNIGIVVNVIFDNPWENDADIYKTLDILTQIKKPFYIMQYSLKIYPGTKLYKDCIDNRMVIPDYNLWFDNYNVIRKTDINRIVILSQFLPRSFIMSLYKRKGQRFMKIFIRIIYMTVCMIMPFHALRVSGSKKLSRNLAIVFSHRDYALTWIKGLLGMRE